MSKYFISVHKALSKELLNCYLSNPNDTEIDLLGASSLELQYTNGQEIDGNRYMAHLQRVDFDKKVYSPGEVKLSYSAYRTASGGNKNIADILKCKFLGCSITVAGLKENHILENKVVKPTVYERDEKGEIKYEDKEKKKPIKKVEGNESQIKEELNKNMVYIAQNYYVHSISMSKRGSSDLNFVLHCYSPDKKLQKDLFSRCHTGKKLAGDICKTHLTASKITDLDYDCSVGRLYMMGYAMKSTTGSGSSSSQSQKSPASPIKYSEAPAFELKHPYLVQYNESFYDFICRVTHRCGEFLYHDNGKFQIGLPSKTIDVLKGGTAPAAPYTSKPLCNFPEIANDDFGKEKLYIAKCTGELKSADAKGAWNAEVCDDDNIRVLTDKDDTADAFGSPKLKWMFFSALGTMNTSCGWEQVVKNVGTDFLKNVTAAGVANEWEKSNYKKIVEKYVSEMGLNGMGTNDICNDYFNSVEKWERQCEREAVELDFASNLPALSIGQAFKLSETDTSCVVYRIHGSFGFSGQNVFNAQVKVEVAPFIKHGTSNIVVPPLSMISNVRYADPMEAIVTNNDDPLRIGRVRVKFLWQPSGDSPTPWIRVTVPYAGDKKHAVSGIYMTPDVGEHVMLNFVNGNIERPFSVGSVFFQGHCVNSGVSTLARENAPAYQVRTISSGNGHSLVFNDDSPNRGIWGLLWPGVEQIVNVVAAANGESTGGKTRGANIGSFDKLNGGGLLLKDGSSLCKVNLDADNRKISISSKFGDVQIDAFTGITINAPNGDISIKGKNVSIEAGNNLTLASGTNITSAGKSAGYTILGMIGEYVSSVATGITGAFGLDVSKVFDLTYIRTTMDIFLRPVEGTLKIKSNRNVEMTAGVGKITVPRSELSPKVGKDDEWDKNNSALQSEKYGGIKDKFVAMSAIMDSYANGVVNVLDDCSDGINTVLQQYGLLDKKQIEDNALGYYGSRGGITDKITSNNAQELKINNAEGALEQFVQAYNNLLVKYQEWQQKVITSEKWENPIRAQFRDLINISENDLAQFILDNKKLNFEFKDILNVNHAHDYHRYLVDKDIKVAKRMIAFKLICKMDEYFGIDTTKEFGKDNTLTGLKDKIIDDKGNISEASWSNFVSVLVLKGHKEKPTYYKVLSSIGSPITKKLGFAEATEDYEWSYVPNVAKLLNRGKGADGPYAVSESPSNGTILISRSPSNFTKLNEKSTSWETMENYGVASVQDYLRSL